MPHRRTRRMRSSELRTTATMFLGLALVVSGCTSQSPPTGNPTGIRSSNASLERDADGQVVAMSFFGDGVTDADLQKVAAHGKLSRLTLQQCSQISDDGLAVLKDAHELAELELIRVPVTDAGFEHLKSSRSLAELLVGHAPITGAGLRHLENVPIVRLSIHSRTVTGEGLRALLSLSSLKEIELNCPEISLGQLPSLVSLEELESVVANGTPIGSGGLEILRGHPRLRKLILYASEVDDARLGVFNTLSELEELELGGALITNEGLKQLSMESLKSLSLDSCTAIDDSGLRNLAGMRQLEFLNLMGTSVAGLDLTGLQVLPHLKRVLIAAQQFRGNDDTIDALKKLLPNCEVVIVQG